MNKTNRHGGQYWIWAKLLNLVVWAAFALSLFSFCITNYGLNAEEIVESPQVEIVDKTPHILGVEQAALGERIILGFSNVNTTVLPFAKIESWPNNGVEILDVYDGWKQPVPKLHVTIVEPGKYMIAVSYIDTVGDLPTLIALRHIVEVRGPPTPPTPPTPPVPPIPPVPPVPPGPEPGPDPPQPPTSGVVMMVMVTPDQPTADQFEQFLKLRTWADEPSRLDKVALWKITKGQQDSSGGVDANLVAYINLVPQNETLPYLFITQKITNGNGTAILWKGRYSDSIYQEVINKVNQLIQ